MAVSGCVGSFVFIILSFLLNSQRVSAAPPRPIELKSNNLQQIFTGEWMVMFYAPWCPACKQMKPTWTSFSEQWSEEFNIKLGLLNIEQDPGVSGQFLIFSLPTIFHIKDGEVRLYSGSRNQDALINYFNDEAWAADEPLPWWKHPNTLHMKSVAAFFELSQMIKNVHDLLLNEYNTPAWLVYTIFGATTIVIGLLLGLSFVCCCDIICPPRNEVVLPEQYKQIDIQTAKEKRAKSRKKSPPRKEKLSGSDGDEEDSQKDSQEESETPTTSAKDTGVRKRKPRKDK